MNWTFTDERWKKAKGESFHQKGQKVWLVGNTVSVKRRPKKPFGIVVKDSVFPDLWVTVEPRNKEQWSKYWNAYNEKKRFEWFRKLRDKTLRKLEREKKANGNQSKEG